MDFASSSAMAASCSAIGSQCSSTSHQKHQAQLYQATPHHKKQHQGLILGSKCLAHPISGDGDSLLDAAVAATAAAAASVLPVYWFYVHSFSQKQSSLASSRDSPGNLSLKNRVAPVQTFDSEKLTLFEAIQREPEASVATHSPAPELKPEIGLEDEIKNLKKLQTRKEMEVVSFHRVVKLGRIDEGLDILEGLQKDGLLDMNKVYHSNFYQECKKQRAVEQTFRFTRLIQSPTLSTFNMLLSVCSNAADTDGAFGALTALKNAGFKPDCKIYTTLISTCAKASKLDKMFQVFNEMQTLGVDPNLHTYGAMIDGYARSGEVGKAFEIYKTMISKKLKPDSVIFNSLINACGRSGEVKRAFEVFKELKSDQAFIQPNHITMCSLIDACSRAGDVSKDSFIGNSSSKQLLAA